MKIMAVDYGDTRTGLAVCDRTEFLASPDGVIEERNFYFTIQKVAHAVKEYDVQMVVVGYPVNMNGTVGPRAEKCAQFAELLKTKVDVPVELWDERATTLEAQNYLSETGTYGKKRKEDIDEDAATIILESYMTYRHNMQKMAERKATEAETAEK